MLDLVGGDPVVVVSYGECDARAPLRIFANEAEVARLDTLDPLIISELGDDLLRLSAVIPASVLDPARFGLPVHFALSAELGCSERRVRTSPVPMRYVPTLAAFAPPVEPRRFWPSDVPGELLVCDGADLVHVAAGVAVARLAAGFPCGAAELEGEVGHRRYLVALGSGLAAIDPGPVVTWSRAFDLVEAWRRSEGDPVVIYDEAGGARTVMVLDAPTGTDLVGPLPSSTRTPRLVARNLAGDILVLESERDNLAPSLSYFVRTFAAGGAEITTVEAARYEWQAPTYYAQFADDGSALYLTAAPTGEDARWIERVDPLTGARTALTSPSDGWITVLGEVYGRLLVASADDFAWLSPVSGGLLSERFAPESGTSFLRLRVELDGSVVMLAEPVENGAPAAHGLYVFDPDGVSLLRFSSPAALFRWLTHDWTGGSLLGYFDEAHVLATAAELEASLR